VELHPPLIELRSYVLTPGRRDRMIELFDAHFAEAQDLGGMPIMGQFQVADDPNRFVWIRGFPDMASRPERLAAFYGGPVWGQFGQEAIGYVKAYDNVQLLREAVPGSGLGAHLDARSESGSTQRRGVLTVTTYRLKSAAQQPFRDAFSECQAPRIGKLLGTFVTDPTPNNFPNLPIREGEHLFTWFAAFDRMPDSSSNQDDAKLRSFFAADPERLILEPTPRSRLP